ncbi:MAG TPA: CAP domain-containing protein [Kofleriaceae bacterium]|nr:CAP domain-containing protein [Kofleriaceae bacterium]
MRHLGTWLAIALASCDGGAAGPDGAGPPGDGCPGGQVTDGVGEPAALAGITRAHNQVRAMVSPCNPLPPLEWDPQLAATAAAWVAMCRDQDAPSGLIDHNPNRSAGYPSYVGENVFAAGGGAGPGIAQQAVSQWAAEAASYNYATNACSGVCGHYTQLVWRDTRKIGCALGDCPSLTFRTSLVCDYGPGGNVGGQRPY